MELYNLSYSDPAQLRAFAEQHQLTRKQGLIQIFSGREDSGTLQPLSHELSRLLPSFQIIGTSTCGEIDSTGIYEESILLSFSCFSHSDCEVRYCADNSQAGGKRLGEELKDSNVRLVIIFGNPLMADPVHFLNGVAQSAPDLFIAGGNAGNTHHRSHTYVIAGQEVYSEGLAIAIIRSDILEVQTHYSMNWTPIGLEMEVTRCDGNILYELDNRPVFERYTYYLGADVESDFPQSVIGFPLLISADDVVQARDPLARVTNDGILFAGSFCNGQKVRFGVADLNNILDKAQQLAEQIRRQDNTEAIYIYSCTGRKSFMQTYLADELRTFRSCAPMVGFFTYGEYFHTPGDNKLLNITNTFVTLSENTGKQQHETASENIRHTLPPSILKSLTHLVNTTALELREAQKLSEQYKFALDQAAVVAKCDSNGVVTYLNEKYEELSGFPADTLIGKNLSSLFHDHTDKKELRQAWLSAMKNNVWRGTLRANSHSDRGYFVMECIALPMTDSEGKLTELIGIGADITEFLNQKRLINEQRTDPLTGLPSRTRLIEDLKDQSVSLLALVDVRSFKSINDYYGINIGDRLIQQLANILHRLSVAHKISCYRLYSAGFAFIPPAGMTIRELKIHLQEIIIHLDRNPIIIDDEVIDTDLAIGISTGSSHLLAMAEAALQQAKLSQERSSIPVLSSDSHDHLKNQYWIRAVKEALADNRIICHFQPIQKTVTGERNNYEALLRLQEKDGRIVPPGNFLEIIKHTRYYPLITRNVVCAAIAATEKTGCNVSLNLSAEDISNERTMEFIHDQLRVHGGKRLIFEITETDSVRDYDQVRRFIAMIKQFGAAVSIDDFGSGYSNFSHLVELQPDFIKIDGAIITAILTDYKSLLVTESIIDMAHKIGAKIVAEYVADDITLAQLKMLGADYLQGYIIGKPEPL